MSYVFPTELLPRLACPRDLGDLELRGAEARERHVACTRCDARYPVEDGIPRLIDAPLHPETLRERAIRDVEAPGRSAARYEPTLLDHMEIDALLEALDLGPQDRVLELGAGPGRMTREVAARAGEVVGLDISRGALLENARALPPDVRVGLAEADATRPVTPAAAFDRVLGTLASNIPDADGRRRSYAAAARALRPAGRFVFTTHYWGLRARLEGESRQGRYAPDGIYRYLFTPREVHAEVDPYFDRVVVRPIGVTLPLAGRVGLRTLGVDRVARRIPGLRAFGELLLVDARSPRPRSDG